MPLFSCKLLAPFLFITYPQQRAPQTLDIHNDLIVLEAAIRVWLSGFRLTSAGGTKDSAAGCIRVSQVS